MKNYKQLYELRKLHYQGLLIVFVVLMLTMACILSGGSGDKVVISDPSLNATGVSLQKTAQVQQMEQDAQNDLIATYVVLNDEISTNIPEWAAESTRDALLFSIQINWAATKSEIER